MKFLFCIIFSIFTTFSLFADQTPQKVKIAVKSENKALGCRMLVLPPPMSQEEQKNFLAEKFGLAENVNFDLMFEEIKTYGGFAGLCSQLSQYLIEENKIPELLKFKAKRIHSCDGFFLSKNGYVLFCPISKQLQIICDKKIEIAFFNANFAVCKKSDFYKYLTTTTEGIDD